MIDRRKGCPGVDRNGPLFFISAGDPSGDIYGSTLVKELRLLYPGAFFVGLGGPRMKKAGVHLLYPTDRIAAVGFTEIMRYIPHFYGLLRESGEIFREVCPDLVILIDFPGFNLRLAEKARKQGMRTLFYISPQIWAWRKGRYKNLVRDSDEIVVILPFEVDIFREWGKKVHYVGHPVIEEIDAREPEGLFMRRYCISAERPVLGLSPGSRRKEIDYHLPVFLDIARKIRKKTPGIQILLNRAPTIGEDEIRERYLRGDDDIRIINESHHTSIGISTLLLTKSGTSTLEAALLGTPMLVCYRMSLLSYLIARSLVNVSHVSLVNILAEREVVPEYIQSAFTTENLLPAALELLGEESAREKMKSGLTEVSNMLKGERTSAKVACIAGSMIETGRNRWTCQ